MVDSKFHHACDDLLNPTRNLANALLVRVFPTFAPIEPNNASPTGPFHPRHVEDICFTQIDPSFW